MSVSGYANFLRHSLISWQSKKQAVVYRSSIEAEYRALVDSTYEISWLKSLLLDLQVTVPTPSLVMCDNVSTIALANNPIHHAYKNILKLNVILVLHYNCLSKLGICDPYTLPTCKGDNVTIEFTNSNTPIEAADPNTVQVQSLQRLATPPKMKLLLSHCLVKCNRM
ncbi:uncharacterized mitochondrial protein-like protein [Tanacetum coccineum]